MPDNNINNSDLLLLDSSNPIPVSESYKWMGTDPANVTNFIKNISTAEANQGEQEVFKTLISGIPTPWARVMITRLAVCANKSELGTNTLDGCLKAFKAEWRGLIAAYALRKDSFEFSEPIVLLGKDIKENYGDMSILNIYGKMLFNDKPFWVYNNKKIDKDNPPKIQILYFKKSDENNKTKFIYVPVGATSPYSILFPSINYQLSDKSIRDAIPWINVAGKFTDPTENPDISQADLQRLHAFLTNASSQMDAYKETILDICTSSEVRSNNPVDIEAFKIDINKFQTELSRWADELKARLGGNVNTRIPTSVAMPQGPLAKLLNTKFEFWYKSGTLYSSEQPDSFKINDTEVFIDSEHIAAWKQTTGCDYSKSPVYYLRAAVGDSGSVYYLALPFSLKAQKQLDLEHSIFNIMSGNGDLSLQANASNDGKVEVKLIAKLDGSAAPICVCQKTFQMFRIEDSQGKVFVWPDFKSNYWNKYYYYSEFPTNVTGIRMLPEFDEGAHIDSLITYPLNQVATNKHRYEILSSDKPLKSVSVHINLGDNEVNAGLLLIKEEGGPDMLYRQTIMQEPKADAIVGIDFGSTNTCAYFKRDGWPAARPVPFQNRRLALVGFDNPKGRMAVPDELFFISNDETAGNGQVKSRIHLHDQQYIPASVDSDKELARGVPNSASNIAITSVKEFTYTTQVGEMYYNMKWMDDAKNRKISFLSMLWIQICADLFVAGTKPLKLNWSFPSSMGATKRKELGQIYTAVVNKTFGHITCEEFTESESACAYALSKEVALNHNSISIGIDIGGSTSDILVMGNSDGAIKLMTQSSVRMAGGFFFDTINRSKRFRNCIASFVHANPFVNVLNIDDVTSDKQEEYTRAPYYLGNIFDALNDDNQFYKFYSSIYNNIPKVFALPAYVTGMLVFYSGLLVRNVAKKYNYQDLKNINFRYYGKGGRLFEWLFIMMESDASYYYKRCFVAGYGDNNINVVFDNLKNRDHKENKSEVAIGLANDNFVLLDIHRNEEGERIVEKADVIGEKNIVDTQHNNQVLDECTIIPDDLFKNGIHFNLPDTLENFNAFITLFTDFIQKQGLLDQIKDLRESTKNLDVVAFIHSDLEYSAYLKECIKGDVGASYNMPIIIAAALKYLKDVLIPEITK